MLKLVAAALGLATLLSAGAPAESAPATVRVYFLQGEQLVPNGTLSPLQRRWLLTDLRRLPVFG